MLWIIAKMVLNMLFYAAMVNLLLIITGTHAGKIYADTMSVSSRLYPTKVEPDRKYSVEEPAAGRGEIRVRGSVDSVPVQASFQIQEGFSPSSGRYGDSRDYLTTRNYNGKHLDEYITSVTDPDRPFKFQSNDFSTRPPNNGKDQKKSPFAHYNSNDDKKPNFSKFFADFENAYEIPDHQVPDFFHSSTSQTPTKPTKKPVVKKGQKSAPYLQDEKLKEITLVHQKALDELNEFATKIKASETKPRPLYEFFPFFNSKPTTTINQSFRNTGKTSTTKKPKSTKNSFLPIAGSITNHNSNTRYRFENQPTATRLNQFIQSSEDEKLERAVRKALENMRRGRTSGRGQIVGPNAKGTVPGGGPPPFRPRRPYNTGPAPVRVFNFNN